MIPQRSVGQLTHDLKLAQARIEQLEAELRTLKPEFQAATSELRAVRAENVRLLGRVKRGAADMERLYAQGFRDRRDVKRLKVRNERLIAENSRLLGRPPERPYVTTLTPEQLRRRKGNKEGRKRLEAAVAEILEYEARRQEDTHQNRKDEK